MIDAIRIGPMRTCTTINFDHWIADEELQLDSGKSDMADLSV